MIDEVHQTSFEETATVFLASLSKVYGKVVKFERMVVYRYPIGPGFEVHHDELTSEEVKNAQTTGATLIGGDVTICVQLSDADEYAGGELIFPKHGLTWKGPKGSAIIHPATQAFPHGVHPITRGERFSAILRGFVRTKA